MSGANAAFKQTFDWVIHVGEYALIEPATMENLWGQFEDGSIGTKPVSNGNAPFPTATVRLDWSANGRGGTMAVVDGQRVTIPGYPARLVFSATNSAGTTTYTAVCAGFGGDLICSGNGVASSRQSPTIVGIQCERFPQAYAERPESVRRQFEVLQCPGQRSSCRGHDCRTDWTDYRTITSLSTTCSLGILSTTR